MRYSNLNKMAADDRILFQNRYVNMSKSESSTPWQNVRRAFPSGEDASEQLVISPETRDSIRDVFSSEVSEDAVKAFKTPLDNDSLAKVVC